MRAGEVARRAGVNVETLRYYRRRGLLPEPARMPGGRRRFDEETVRFLCAVKEAQAAGFTLAEIEDYLKVVQLRMGQQAGDPVRAGTSGPYPGRGLAGRASGGRVVRT